MKILVFGGGDSTEREVSIRSANAVAGALAQAGFDVSQADPREGLEVLNTLPHGSMVFPILHGSGGEDGRIQAELEKRKIPYLGTQSRASAVCFDKAKTRAVYKKAKLPVAEGAVVTHDTYRSHELAKKPHVLKITEGGSSIGTYIVRAPESIDQTKVDEVFSLGVEAVLEELVSGVEITVPVLDSESTPVVEIQPPESGEFDYENKYNGETKEICPPISIDETMQARACELAEKAHKSLNCRHISRTDMIVRPNGDIVLLETNTMPGMTDQSLVPLSVSVMGMDMMALVTKFVDMVARDYDLKGEKA